MTGVAETVAPIQPAVEVPVEPQEPSASYGAVEGGMVEIARVMSPFQNVAASFDVSMRADMARQPSVARRTFAESALVHAEIGLFRTQVIAGDMDDGESILGTCPSPSSHVMADRLGVERTTWEDALSDWLSSIGHTSPMFGAAVAIPVLAAAGCVLAIRQQRRRRQDRPVDSVDPTICDVLFSQLPCLQLESIIV